jgi:hypothetical protein
MVYIARDEKGTILGVFTTLQLLHQSHEFSNHARLDKIESFSHGHTMSIATLKDGTEDVVNIELHPVYDTVEHL